MRKLLIILVFVLLVAGCIFALVIYQYNKNFEEEQVRHSREIEGFRQEQARLDAEFSGQQQAKRQKQIASEQELASRLKQDKDGDGLTYQQELLLGTSDAKADTDGDGIRDNVDRHPAGGGETYRFTIPWTHAGQRFITQFGIAEDRYWYYKDQNRTISADSRFATPHDPVIMTIAKDIADASVSSGDPCEYCLAIDFVESMTYQYDLDYNSNRDYPKYAIETIVDKRGDCEDTSFLMASILGALDMKTILLVYSDHMAVGFLSDTCPGDSYTYQGGRYCFLETTGVPDNPEDFFSVWGKYVNEKPHAIEVS